MVVLLCILFCFVRFLGCNKCYGLEVYMLADLIVVLYMAVSSFFLAFLTLCVFF